MDDTKAIFKKIKSADRNSFEALSERYGWKLYSYIRRNSPDRETADRIFSESIGRFYAGIENYHGDDPVEAMLFFCADQASRGKKAGTVPQENMGQWQIGHEAGFTLPPVDLSMIKRRKEPVWLRVFYGVCIVILVLGILAAAWIMIWMLMNMHILPEMDLGYSWFNQHIMRLF